MEKKRIQQSLIMDEMLISKHLNSHPSIEKIIDHSIDSRGFNVTIAESIGPSLKELFLLCEQRFSFPTVIMIGIKMVKLFKIRKLI